MTDHDTITARRVGQWAAMALGTYVLMGVIYGFLLFAAAGETLFSGGSLAVLFRFVLPTFYANPARALTAPLVAATALVVSAAAVVLVTRAIQHLSADASSGESRPPRSSR